MKEQDRVHDLTQPIERCCSMGCDICRDAPREAPVTDWLEYFAKRFEADGLSGFAQRLRDAAAGIEQGFELADSIRELIVALGNGDRWTRDGPKFMSRALGRADTYDRMFGEPWCWTCNRRHEGSCR